MLSKQWSIVLKILTVHPVESPKPTIIIPEFEVQFSITFTTILLFCCRRKAKACSSFTCDIFSNLHVHVLSLFCFPENFALCVHLSLFWKRNWERERNTSAQFKVLKQCFFQIKSAITWRDKIELILKYTMDEISVYTFYKAEILPSATIKNWWTIFRLRYKKMCKIFLMKF